MAAAAPARCALHLPTKLATAVSVRPGPPNHRTHRRTGSLRLRGIPGCSGSTRLMALAYAWPIGASPLRGLQLKPPNCNRRRRFPEPPPSLRASCQSTSSVSPLCDYMQKSIWFLPVNILSSIASAPQPTLTSSDLKCSGNSPTNSIFSPSQICQS